MSDDRPRPMSRAERLLRGTPTAGEIHQLARQQRQGLRKSYVPAEVAAWERTIRREVSAAAQSLDRWRRLRPGEPEGPKTATLVYDIAFLTALWLHHADRCDLIMEIVNRERRMSAEEYDVWSVRTLRRHYMDSLVPHFSIAKKEHEGQKQLQKTLSEVPPELRPHAPLANAGEFQYVDGRLVFGDGPFRPVSDGQQVYMRELLKEYGPQRGRPRVKNPKPATLRKRRQRERERKGVTNSCVRNTGGQMLATDEQLAQDAERLVRIEARFAKDLFEIREIAQRLRDRFPTNQEIAETVDTLLRDALSAS
jgi:hypothetical protein